MLETDNILDRIVEIIPEKAYLVVEKTEGTQQKNWVFETRRQAQAFANTCISDYINEPINEERPFLGKHWKGRNDDNQEVTIDIYGVEGGELIHVRNKYKAIILWMSTELAARGMNIDEQLEKLYQLFTRPEDVVALGYDEKTVLDFFAKKKEEQWNA